MSTLWRFIDRYHHLLREPEPPVWEVYPRDNPSDRYRTVRRFQEEAVREARRIFGDGPDLRVERVGGGG